MNTQTPSKSVKTIYDNAPRKVTPDTSRLIVRVELPLPFKDQDKSESSSFEAFGLPFVDMDKIVKCALIPRPDASKGAATLMSALPVPKLTLRRRVNLAMAHHDAPPIILPSLPTEAADEVPCTSDNENKELCFTPGPPARSRRSPPPALIKRFVSCELLPPANMPSELLLPSIK
jgi:hypothetical protein